MIVLILNILPIALLSACGTADEAVLHSLGEYEDYILYSEENFQDRTYYGNYFYTSVNLVRNEYFKRIQESDLAEIDLYLDDFEKWVDVHRRNNPTSEIGLNYNFCRELIDVEDYFFIYDVKIDEEMQILQSYDIYFLDFQSLTLYYFHSNV